MILFLLISTLISFLILISAWVDFCRINKLRHDIDVLSEELEQLRHDIDILSKKIRAIERRIGITASTNNWAENEL